MSLDVQDEPMCRLTLRKVRSGLVIACRLATSPTRTSPALVNATTDGVVREPSEFGTTTGSPASRTDTTELVVRGRFRLLLTYFLLRIFEVIFKITINSLAEGGFGKSQIR